MGSISTRQPWHCFVRFFFIVCFVLTATIALTVEQPQSETALSKQELEKRFTSSYVLKDTFGETLTATCRKLEKQEGQPEDALGDLFVSRLKSDFTEDFNRFVGAVGVHSAGTILRQPKQAASEIEKATGLVIDLLFEYRPLTESQLAQETDADRKRWEASEQIKARYEKLKARGADARLSPEWIEIIFEAGKNVDFRPTVREAVAPYVKPETPPTRSLSAAEAEQMLQRDWLHQADQKPTIERIQQEIQWARALADRIEASHPGQVDFSKARADLDALQKRATTNSTQLAEFYFDVRRVKRSIMFANPLLDFDKILMVDMPFPAGSEWRHQTRHRLGYMAVPGGRLLVLNGLSPAGELTQLMPQAPLHGSFWRPDLSFDGKKVVFCFKPHNEKSFHLYEIGVDGSGLVQLTDGPFDDLDPIYLPDGEHLMFSTTRGHTYVRCMPPTNAYVLARCDRDGKNVYLISYNNEPDFLPSVMNDGRIIYTRWEYTDKPLWRAQALWTTYPDGTQVSTFWGNQSVWPDLLKDARSISGSQRVMFTGSAHHDWFSGSIGMIDPSRGSNFPNGLTKITADVPWPEVGNGPVDPIESPDYHPSGKYRAYYSPYPLSEHDFLVSAERDGKFVLYLMDVDGNRELIYEGDNHIFHAMPLKARARPAVLTDTVAWPDRENRDQPEPGVIYSNNIYEGAPEELQGKVKYLRIIKIDPKTYTHWHKRPYISTGPVVSIVQSDGVKRVLGTVPVEEDGSMAFYAPPSEALHFQLLDDQYRALQTMRSFTGVMPGEWRGCLGCHEQHSKAPEQTYHKTPISLIRGPRKITPPPWDDHTVSFDRYVQPVLDQYCGECHQGDGEATKVLDLTSRPGFLMFKEPYITLTGKPTWGAPYKKPDEPPPGWGIANTIMVESFSTTDPEGYVTPKPMTALSYNSRLIELASSGTHYDVRVDPINLRRLITWVDTICPYRGDEEVRELADPVFQGADWLAIPPKIKNAPIIVRPGPVDSHPVKSAPPEKSAHPEK